MAHSSALYYYYATTARLRQSSATHQRQSPVFIVHVLWNINNKVLRQYLLLLDNCPFEIMIVGPVFAVFYLSIKNTCLLSINILNT